MGGRLQASVADDMPFLVRDRLTPSSIPPASPCCGALRMVTAHPSCQGPWNFCRHASFSGLGLFPIEAGRAQLSRGFLLVESPVPTGATALLGGFCCHRRVREAMRPVVLEQADGPRARMCWHCGRAHEEESVEGFGADPGEAKVTGLGPATQTRTAQVHDEIRRRTGLRAPGTNGEATGEFPFEKSACVGSGSREGERHT